MSYILDALNKAERERKRGAAPALESGPIVTSDVSTPHNPWPWIALLAVVFNAALAALLVWSSLQDKPGVAEQAPVTAVPTPPPAAATAPLNSAPPAEPAAPPQPKDPLDTLRPAQPTAPKSTIPLMTDAELQQQARSRELEEQAVAAQAAAPPPPEPRDETPPPLETIPLQIELPPELQQALPPLRVDVHVFDDARANRFVMINLRRYREGDEIAPGLTLERVTKEGMVLIFRGERFRFLNPS